MDQKISELSNKTPTTQKTNEFETVQEDVKLDLIDIDGTLSIIKSKLVDYETQIAQLDAQIQIETDLKKRGELYKVKNITNEKAIGFHEVHVRLLELKFRYRKEQSEAVLRKLRYQTIELPKMESVENQGMTTSDTIGLMKYIKQIVEEIQVDKNSNEPRELSPKAKEFNNRLEILDRPEYKI